MKKFYLIIGIVIIVLLLFALPYWLFCCPVSDGIVPDPTLQKTYLCKGTARCYYAEVTKIIDGDTLEVDNVSIRLALVDAPEYDEEGGVEAAEFVMNICEKGSRVLIDEDDGQTGGSFDRVIAVVYCKENYWNINSELLKGAGTIDQRYCNVSEFANEDWAKDECSEIIMEEECNSIDPLYCESDDECMFSGKGCYTGNKEYYEKCFCKDWSWTIECEKLCSTPSPKSSLICLNNKCMFGP